MTTENDLESEKEYFNLITEGLHWVANKIGSGVNGAYSAVVGDKGIKGMVMPAVVGAIIGAGGFRVYSGVQNSQYKGSLIAENGVSEKVIEGVSYTELKQNNGGVTHFMGDGRVGKTLEAMESELKAKAEEVYDFRKSEIEGEHEESVGVINTKYDSVNSDSSRKARTAWGLSNPLEVAVEEPVTNFHENLNALGADYDEVLGGRK